jgi:hypothetical protein
MIIMALGAGDYDYYGSSNYHDSWGWPLELLWFLGLAIRIIVVLGAGD